MDWGMANRMARMIKPDGKWRLDFEGESSKKGAVA